MFTALPRTLMGGSRATSLLKHKTKVMNTIDYDQFHQVSGEHIVTSQVSGMDHLRDPRLNKGLAFTLEERQALGIHGLQPARFKTQDEQIELCWLSVNRYKDPLNKHLYLSELHDRNEKLFFRLLSENVEALLPIVYTPTVGLACQKFGLIYRRPRGLFITINDKGHIFDVLKNWPEHDVRAVCMTDGERILGLGDLGACGMGIPVGKLALYTALGGFKPHHCLPIQLDVGTNNESLLEDPLYIGLRQKRTTGQLYDEFVDEFMHAVVQRYGQHTIIQFEDFGNHNAFRFLDKYKNTHCTFNDDIQGTASVCVAGLLAAKKATKKKMHEHTYLYFGAGEAALGIADLSVCAMEAEGISTEEARSKIFMMDIDGLLAKGRPEGKLDGHKAYYTKDMPPMKSLIEIVKKVKPSILIGASACAKAFTPEVLQEMAKINKQPVIFALSNPTSKAECTATEAYENTEGRVIFASGSPFGKVSYNGKDFYPGQGNNAYVYPGIALGSMCSRIHHIKDEIFLIAAQALADFVTDDDINRGSLYPPLSIIRPCSITIATKIAEYAYEKGLATHYPEPVDKRKFIEGHMFNVNYESALPHTYPWPQMPLIKVRPLGEADVKTL